MSLSRCLIGAALVAGTLLLWWFTAGASFVRVVDKAGTVSERIVTVTQFDFDEANEATFEPAALSFDSRRRMVGADWRIGEGATGHIALETSKGRMLLGIVTRRSSTNHGRRIYTFAPESADVVTLERRHSRISWPRPFVISWLGGRLPFWSRYAYDRIVWRKAGGEVLDVMWTDQQLLEPGSGWMDQFDPKPPKMSIRR